MTKPSDCEIWVTYPAMEWLDNTLQPGWIGFEWGSGQSTVWLANRILSLISIEHDKEWFIKTSRMVRAANALNVTLIHEPNLSSYANIINKYNSFDIIFIDGRNRVECMKSCIQHVAPMGIVVLDNSERARYAEGIEIFKRWERLDFAGPGRNSRKWSTSVWIKP